MKNKEDINSDKQSLTLRDVELGVSTKKYLFSFKMIVPFSECIEINFEDSPSSVLKGYIL